MKSFKVQSGNVDSFQVMMDRSKPLGILKPFQIDG